MEILWPPVPQHDGATAGQARSADTPATSPALSATITVRADKVGHSGGEAKSGIVPSPTNAGSKGDGTRSGGGDNTEDSVTWDVNGPSIADRATRLPIREPAFAPRLFTVTPGGSITFRIDFYSARDGASGGGARLSTAVVREPIHSDSSLSITVSPSDGRKAVASVSVMRDQHVEVGGQAFLNFTARDAAGKVIALAPSAESVSVHSGADKLAVEGEVLRGISGGTAQVSVTVEGITSAPVPILVTAPLKIALIASSENAGAISLIQVLAGRNITPTVFDSVPEPSTLQDYNVLILTNSGKIGTADAPRVKAFLQTGRGGVVLLSAVPAMLCGTLADLQRGNEGGQADTSAISSWFGGVTAMRPTWPRLSIRSTPNSVNGGLMTLPASLPPGTSAYVDHDHIFAFVLKNSILNPTTDQLLVGDSVNGPFFPDIVGAFAYETPAGGRVFWMFHPLGINQEYGEKIVTLLLAGVSWAAKQR